MIAPRALRLVLYVLVALVVIGLLIFLAAYVLGAPGHSTTR